LLLAKETEALVTLDCDSLPEEMLIAKLLVALSSVIGRLLNLFEEDDNASLIEA
jgi:hypothetical protein